MKLRTIVLACIVAVQHVLAWNLNIILDSGFGKNMSNTTATSNISAESSGIQKRYAEMITSGSDFDLAVTVWPYRQALFSVGEGPLRRIPFCYVDQRSYECAEKETCLISTGIQIWFIGLGGRGDRAAYHSIMFVRPKNPEEHCCTRYTYDPENIAYNEETDLKCEWNAAKYPKDTLAIHWLDNVKMAGNAAQASQGYAPRRTGEDAGRHFMHVSDLATPAISHMNSVMVVFRMAHKFQRWDRDEYVEFRCDERLDGLEEAANSLAEARKIEYPEALVILCEDYKVVEQFNSPSASYSRQGPSNGDGLNCETKPVLDGPDGFDIDSIMMYPSMAGSDVREEDATLDEAILIKTRKDNRGHIVPAGDWYIPRRTRVSPKDIAFIRKFYPWDETRAKQHHEH
ncbi:hypothetical protein BU23DRAFT_569092 [Bimuria novae-zelandiae CBS 107.79]|uniref:Uncharacterized protein n=1 Tax=Bimuria novae-zelandiae CBS 107.79 TaxID=1447943 RepID=A0A6A5V6U8_9PLEO|nr:hypothetical protein BU23DRAFT_569092 [Bimuria novae-zelandiae CBS 107.79]